jgi:hypothetical protein
MREDNLITVGRRLPPVPLVSTDPDWVQSRPAWIERALRHATTLPSGGW